MSRNAVGVIYVLSFRCRALIIRLKMFGVLYAYVSESE